MTRLLMAKHAVVLVSTKLDFPKHNGVGAGMVRDGLCVVARDYASHARREPRLDMEGLHAIPAATEDRECLARLQKA